MSKKISLVLSSGGARGLTQIGVIEELIDQGYTINAVSGSSIGAAIGGLYTIGKLKKYKEWIISLNKTDVFKLFDFTFSTQGVLKGEKVFEEMKRLFGDSLIEDSAINFTAVATDIKQNKEVWIQKGSLFKAIRSSVSVPTILTPIYHQDSILIDGGVSSPIPIDPIKNQDHDLVVVVNAYSNNSYKPRYKPTKKEKKEEDEYMKRLAAFRNKWSEYFPKTNENEKKPKKIEKLGYMSLMNKTIEFMENKIIEHTLEVHKPDIVVNIPKDICGLFEFYRAEELIEEGRLLCRETLEKWDKEKSK